MALLNFSLISRNLQAKKFNSKGHFLKTITWNLSPLPSLNLHQIAIFIAKSPFYKKF